MHDLPFAETRALLQSPLFGKVFASSNAIEGGEGLWNLNLPTTHIWLAHVHDVNVLYMFDYFFR